ncbi:MAG: thioesterase [Bacteroidales bacterium]|nr:thioesterase [Bacteroidales bacterium]
MMRYSYSYTITATDMDNNYRLQPAAILAYFEDCFARYMSVKRLAAFDLVKEDLLWIITEFSARKTDKDALWSEVITVEMWISEITPLRIYSDFRIHMAGNPDDILYEGTSCWSLINAVTHRPEKTDRVSGSIEIVPDIMVEHRKKRLPDGGEEIARAVHKVNLLDLDFNKHVNNRSYLSIAMLTTTEEFLTTNTVGYFTVHWLAETYLGDTITCSLSRMPETEGTYLHTLTNDNGKKVAQIYSEWHKTSNPADISTSIERI